MRFHKGGEFAENPVFIDELKKFDAISLREPTYKNKMAGVIGKDVEDVCDPSLLLTEEEYAKKEKKVWCLPKRYVAVFDLNGEPFLKECAMLISKDLDLPLVSLAGGYKRWCDRSLMGISPEQWIYVMRHATFICTNSFHGTAFAINFRKPFATIASRKESNRVRDGRKINILQQCDLISRYVENKSQLKGMNNCDFTMAEPSIYAYKMRSIEWLKNALK